MKEKVFIAVDCGKHSVKGFLEYRGKLHIVYFRTKVQSANDFGGDLQPNSFKVKFEGKEYIIGNMVSEDYSDHNLSKESLVHKISLYTAIVELMKKAQLEEQFHNVELHLAINSPINVYKSQRLKNSYKTFMENNNQPISIRVNEKRFVFHLKDITICFEGTGLVYHATESYQKHTSVVIDIGGLNTTMCIFNGIHPDFDSMIVANLGISSLKAKIGRKLVERYGMSISSFDLEQIIQRGYFTHGGKKIEESSKIIKELKRNHVDNIINFAKQHGYTFNQDKIFIVGGGSILLCNEFTNLFPEVTIVVNPQFANAKSFLEILKVKYKS